MTATALLTATRELVPLMRVQDMHRAVVFYCLRLGFQQTQSWEPDGVLNWCRLERGGAALMLQLGCDEDGPAAAWSQGVAFYFNCDDAAAVHREFADRGLELPPPERAFYGMDQVYLTDPDGYQLCFQSVVS